MISRACGNPNFEIFRSWATNLVLNKNLNIAILGSLHKLSWMIGDEVKSAVSGVVLDEVVRVRAGDAVDVGDLVPELDSVELACVVE